MGILDTIIQTKHSETLRSFDPENIIDELLSSLKERERSILMKRYGLKGQDIETLAAIGSELSLTRERVRQLGKDIIKQLRTNSRQSAALNQIRDMVVNLILEHGKIIAEEMLLKHLGIKNSSDRNAIIFVLHLIEEIESYLHNNYKQCWKSLMFNRQLLEEFSAHAHAVMETYGQPMKESHFLEEFKKTDFFLKMSPDLKDKVILNFLDLVHNIEKNVFKEWGLVKWKQIVPKDVGDKAFLVLKKHGKPEHYSKITELINSSNFDNRTAYKETVHNELIKDKRFILVGRGIYALSEWGYKPGVVSDVIKEILINSPKPLSKEKIVEEVLKKRQVKKNTILVSISNKKLFKKVDRNLYALA